MLQMAGTKPTDYVIDLGSGDGRTIISAAKKFGENALGVEYNPDMVELSKRNAAKEGVADKAQFVKADLFESDFSQAQVITMFLLPSINLKLRPKILDMKPGVRVVSNSFDMDDWMPDERIKIAGECKNFCSAYFWIVPAKSEGRWKTPDGELALKQKFQMLSGTLGPAPIANGRLRGDEISFSAGGAQYTGHVNGNTIHGTVKGGSGGSWTATRQ